MVTTPIGAVSSLEITPIHNMQQTTDFASLLGTGLAAVNERANVAAGTLAAYAVGEGVSTHELMIALEQAKLSMQFAIEVRNRLLEAYQELSRLQI